jgi:endo-1,4-beta-xylanase
MVPIHATLVSQDNNSGPLSIVLKSITSNEPDNGKGDGNTINDIQGATIGTLDTDFILRAERSSKGTGRIYTITYTITDAAGNQSTAIATVKVNKGTKDDDRDQHDDHENDGHESQDN